VRQFRQYPLDQLPVGGFIGALPRLTLPGREFDGQYRAVQPHRTGAAQPYRQTELFPIDRLDDTLPQGREMFRLGMQAFGGFRRRLGGAFVRGGLGFGRNSARRRRYGVARFFFFFRPTRPRSP
ncbi:MAG: hypothetical protein QG656_2107, partial [Candidatus Hydrogenedentes bacterium]|nr:hypothetical protein [Candidatus Hydrogenedentota bacterium]